MENSALDTLLSTFCAQGSTLYLAVKRCKGVLPVIVAWSNDFRTTVCGPWNDPFQWSDLAGAFGSWRCFDYELTDNLVVIHVKRKEA